MLVVIHCDLWWTLPKSTSPKYSNSVSFCVRGEEEKKRQRRRWRRWVIGGGSDTEVESSASPPLQTACWLSHLLDQFKINASGRSVHLGCPRINI